MSRQSAAIAAALRTIADALEAPEPEQVKEADPWMSLKDMGKLLSLDPSFLSRAALRGDFRTQKFGRAHRVRTSEVEAYAKRHTRSNLKAVGQ